MNQRKKVIPAAHFKQQPETKPEDIKGDIEKITKGTQAFLEWFQPYCIENKIDVITAFMISHNIHKQVVSNSAILLANEIPVNKTIQMADMTFRNAMRDLRRRL